MRSMPRAAVLVLLVACSGVSAPPVDGAPGEGADGGEPPAPPPSDGGETASLPLAVTSPTATSKWAEGSLHWLTWDGTTSTASFEVSLDSGLTWVAPETEVISVYYPSVPRRELWRVPPAPTGAIKVRVVDRASGLVAPAVTLTIIPSQKASYVWQQMATNAFAPRDGAALESFNGELRLYGGWDAQFDKVSTNEVLTSPTGATWTEDSRAPWEERHTFGFAQHAGKLFVLGGDAQQWHYQPDVWSTADGTNWELVANAVPWGERVLHYALAYDGALWVMGGQTLPEYVGRPPPVTYYNDVWRSYDGANWTRVLQHAPWRPRGAIGGRSVFQNEMWIVGGGTYDTLDVPTRTLYADAWSSTNGVKWTKHTDPPWFPRQYHSLEVFDGRLWVLGGYTWQISENLTEVWYTVDGENWYELEGTPWNERHAASTVVTADGLYIGAGGWSDMWRLTRSSTSP
ncbi:MAG: hypothetical protein KF819_34940 [Labilithrix sp.]|nr:hypothetical protein [Labilithrix sp.]